nr:MAG TPA: hypothetical protein [Caudoviricetes sp.]
MATSSTRKRALPTSTSGRNAPTGQAKHLKGGPEDGNIHAETRSASLGNPWKKQTERSGRCCHPWPRPGRCRPSGW